MMGPRGRDTRLRSPATHCATVLRRTSSYAHDDRAGGLDRRSGVTRHEDGLTVKNKLSYTYCIILFSCGIFYEMHELS